MSLIRSAVCGLLAGAAGTLAMDLLWYVRYTRGGGTTPFLEWEFANAPTKWEDAGAPAKILKLIYESSTGQTLPETRIQLASNVMHWVYGTQWGSLMSFGVGSPRRLKRVQGPLFGALVWLSSYVSVPIAGFYKPIWSYDLKTLWDDLSAHLVYGVATAVAYRLTCRF
jgi:uncharacterized membrane protein YagU involved in acid resistance